MLRPCAACAASSLASPFSARSRAPRVASPAPQRASCFAEAIGIGASSGTAAPFSVTLGGSACDAADLHCSGDNACEVSPHAVGTCHIVVAVRGGPTITKDIGVVSYGGCCTQPQPQAGHVEVPALPETGAD